MARFLCDAGYFKDDSAWTDFACPEGDCAFTLSHTNFGRFSRDRDVGEDADPGFTSSIHMEASYTSGGF